MKILFVFVLIFSCTGCVTRRENAQWDDVVWMENTHWRVGVSASAGRIVHLSVPGAENKLRLNEGEIGNTEPPAGRWDWRDFGGDWLWPVAQEDWYLLGTHKQWPPPTLFEYAPWMVHQVEYAQGERWLRMVLELAEPLHIRVERKIVLPDSGREMRVEQSLERMAQSGIPVCLWQVAQRDRVEHVWMDLNEASALAGGYRLIQGKDPATTALKIGEGVLRFTTGIVNCKLGTDGEWIADSDLWIGVRNSGAGPGLPDGGCSVALAHHPAKGYVELETMSRRRNLSPGERLVNVLVYRHSRPAK